MKLPFQTFFHLVQDGRKGERRNFDKKYGYLFIRIVVGAALTLSAGVAAEEFHSVIGKKIDSEYTVTLNGQELAVKAGAIEGTSYLPVP